MNKIITCLIASVGLAVSSLSAADFTGTITWAMRVDITDPEMKRQMEASSSPEMQEQMKAAQEAMNDPEMQAMLKANPQMRDMMEKQMKAMSKGPGEMFPKSTTLHMKGTRSLVRTEGGAAAGDILTLADKNVSYQIDREARTYRKLAVQKTPESMDDKFKVTPTKETTKVLGYTCERYVVETTDSEMKMNWNVWATDDIKGLDARALNRLRVGQSSGPDVFSKIKGVPLKMEITTPQMKMFMDATQVKAESLPDSLFELPAGFKELPAQ